MHVVFPMVLGSAWLAICWTAVLLWKRVEAPYSPLRTVNLFTIRSDSDENQGLHVPSIERSKRADQVR